MKRRWEKTALALCLLFALLAPVRAAETAGPGGLYKRKRVLKGDGAEIR